MTKEPPEQRPSSASIPTSRESVLELLRRHDRPGPRYTSYPTAVEFDGSVGTREYEGLLADAAGAAHEPLSVYLHLPFCTHRCLFCGCQVIVTPHYERTLPYLDLLLREIDLVAERLGERRLVSQLHLGGGTPTYHRPEELRGLLRHLFGAFRAAPGAELAVEIDPRVTSREHLAVLAEFGFNRVSMGVQDFTPQVQEAVARVQSVAQTASLVEAARELGYGGINVDLIYGLPYQSAETFAESLREVLQLGFDRAAVYSFAFVPWMRKHMTTLPQSAFPSAEQKLELFAIAREKFLEAGYEPIGMDHFARPEDELAVALREKRLRRNFQGYTVIPARDVLGLGLSAIGDISGAYVQNVKKLSQYEAAIHSGHLAVERGIRRSADDELRRDVIHQLMCNFEVDVPAIEARHGIEFRSYFTADLERLAALEAEDLVRIEPQRIRATPTGQLFVRNLALCFDRYFRERHECSDAPTFSRTI